MSLDKEVRLHQSKLAARIASLTSRGGLQGISAKLPVPSSAPPPLRPGLSLLSNAAAADTALRSSFFSFPFFFLPRPQPFFPTLHKGQIYLKSLGIIPLPLVQKSCSIVYGFLLFRLPLSTPLPLRLLPIVPSVTYTATCCICSSASAQITSIHSASASFNTFIFYKLLPLNPQRIITLCASVFLPIVL